MGNQISKFKGGYLFLKTDRPYYYPQNIVQGKIYIQTHVPMSPKHIEIEVSGHEKASYKVRRGKHDHQDVFKRKIIGFKGICFKFKEAIDAGDYIIPFEFELPKNIPSSIMWHDHNDWDNNPSCEVVYKIKAYLTTNENQQLKYSQMLIIHERPVEFLKNDQTQETFSIDTCCCLEKGKTSLSVRFDKNVFFSNETAHAEVEVDNSQCLLRIREIEFQICQFIILNNFLSKNYDLLENKDRSGIDAGFMFAKRKTMSLNLGSIKYKVDQFKKEKDGEGLLAPFKKVQRSKQEIFMLQQLAPACHSTLIQNDYFLDVNIKYDTCMCCTENPSISIPLTIIPQTDPSMFGLEEPPGYSPVDLGSFKFSLQRYNN